MLKITDKTEIIQRNYIEKYTENYKDYGFTKITIKALLKEHRVTAGVIDYHNLKAIDIMKAYCKIQVNYSKLIYGKSRTDLLYNGEENHIDLHFDYLCNYISPYLPLFQQFKPYRVDYTVDLNVPTEAILEYIRVLKKSGLNNYFTNGGVYKTSISAHTRSYNLNFYDKFEERKTKQIDELIRNGYSNITSEELQNTQNTFRIEVQCYKPKLDRLKNKYDILTEWETSQEVVIKHIDKNFYTGSIYTYEHLKNEVIPLVFSSIKQQHKALKLIDYIRFGNHTVRKAIEKSYEIAGVKERTAKDIFKQIHEYKGTDNNYTCIIPLQKRAKINYLPDIIYLIDKAYDKQIF